MRSSSSEPMQSVGRSRTSRRLGTFGLVALIVALAGCAGFPGELIPGTAPLVSIKLEGGMCPDGVCQAAWTLQNNGRVVTQTEPPEELGVAAAEAMSALVVAVRTADYAAIRAKPFTGTCPTAFDGQEVVLEYSAPGGIQTIRSCETEIDWTHPLFAATVAALGSLVPLPTDY